MTAKGRLLASVHAVDPHGTVWAIHEGIRRPVYNVTQLAPEYQSLLIAAPLMFKAISLGLPMLDTIAQTFELNNLDSHVGPLMQLEAGLNFAIRTMTETTKRK